jgi:AraC-like DNA-binding protein
VPVFVRRPAAPLAGLVQAIVYRAGEQPKTSVEKIMPSPETGLWVNLNRDAFRSFDDSGKVSRVPGAMLAGPTSRASVIEFEEGHAHVSVAFALGAASFFLRPPLTLELARDELVPLEILWGRSGGCLRERLLEARTPADALSVMESALLEQLTGALAPDPAVIAAARALSLGGRVGEVSDELGLLPRTLRRRFTAQVGLTPKRFAMVQRMQRVVRDLDGQSQVDWAAAAAKHGYVDQPHLADEFRALAGVTPGEYLRSRLDGPNHLRVKRSVTAGPCELHGHCDCCRCVLLVAWCAPAGRGQGCSGQRACLFTEFLQQGAVSLVRAGNSSEVRGMVIRGPLVEGMGTVPGRVDRGEAAASAVDDVACGGEREGRHRDAESPGRGEQVERRVAAAGERSGLRLPDHGRVHQQ